MLGEADNNSGTSSPPSRKVFSRWTITGIVILILVVVGISATFFANDEGTPDFEEPKLFETKTEESTDIILIGWKSSTTASRKQSEIAAIKRNEGLESIPDQALEKFNISKVKIPPAQLEEATQDEIVDTLVAKYITRGRNEIGFIEADKKVFPAFDPNDPWFTPLNQTGNLNTNAQYYLEAQYAQQAWDIARGVVSGGEAIKIAVLDTGVYCGHTDLVANCLPGWNTVTNNTNTNDNAGHGTAVAGTASATTNNSTGVASVGFSAKIIPVKITDPNGAASYSSIASGILWAADNGANVINVSWGNLWSSNAVKNAANYARQQNIITVVSAGNDCSQVSGVNSESLLVASAWSVNGISIAGNGCSALYPVEKERLSSFSNYGSQIDFSAGHSSFTTGTSGLGNVAGTSISAPYISGTIALMLSINPELTPTQVEQILKETALDWEAPGWDMDFGWGRVDTGQAVTRTYNMVNNFNLSPPTSPVSTFSASTVGIRTTVNLSWQASTDDVGVSGYKIYRNSIPIANVTSGTTHVTSADNLVAWNPSTTPPGQNAGTYYFIRAYDAANNYSAPSNVMFVLPSTGGGDVTAPVVSVTNPSNGATVGGTVTLAANASDNVSVTKVDFLVDGAIVGSDTTSPYSLPWNSTSVTNGSHQIQAKAYDPSNNVGSSAFVGVNVSNNQTQSLELISYGVSGKTATSANILATVNIPSSIVINYGTNRNNLNQNVSGGTATQHTVALTGLAPRTVYYYQVVVSAGGQSVSSPISSFRTKNR